MNFQNGVSIQDRLHADVHRAVGGSLNLLRELSRISFQFDPNIPADWMIKRVQFFAYELDSVPCASSSERDRLARLNRFFFEDKNFRCLAGISCLSNPAQAYLLSSVLTSRSGAPTVLAPIYAFLAQKTGVALDFIDLKPKCFLKWNDQGRSRFIDIARGGATLSNEEVIAMLQDRFQMPNLSRSNLLEPYTFENYLSDYVSDLKAACGGSQRPELLLFLLNTLISYQPSNLTLLAERAILQRRLGHFKCALADLKRYFTFFPREKAARELTHLHDELVTLLKRHQTSIEILD